MKELYQITEFQSAGTGKWHCGNFKHLDQNSAAWYLPARVLGLDLCDYIDLLINKYHVTPRIWDESKGFFLGDWPDYRTIHSFVIYINKVAKQKGYYINWAD